VSISTTNHSFYYPAANHGLNRQAMGTGLLGEPMICQMYEHQHVKKQMEHHAHDMPLCGSECAGPLADCVDELDRCTGYAIARSHTVTLDGISQRTAASNADYSALCASLRDILARDPYGATGLA
jgi:hypothetical protein